MSGNQTLISHAGVQASTLIQFSNAIRPVTLSARNHIEPARSANSMASDSRFLEKKGGQVVSTMSDIQNSSKKVTETITVINSIAFQNNILSLHVPVEMVHVEERGQGFSVVATEVKAFVQRTSHAAHQIRVLIGDSVEKTELDTEYVSQTCTAMTEIVSSAANVSQTLQEISEASNSQLSGPEEMNKEVDTLEISTKISLNAILRFHLNDLEEDCLVLEAWHI